MGEVRKELGMQIKKRRVSKKMTQSNLAELLGSNQEYISKLENGLVNFSIGYLIHIANVLDLNLSCVFINKYEDRENN